MSDYKETLSAFLDDAAKPDDINRLMSESEDHCSGLARRYQMIGEVLRGELGHAAFIDVSKRVREQIQSIATPLQGQTGKPSRASTPLFDFSQWVRPLTGLAVAASVALVVVVSVADFESTPADNAVKLAEQTIPARPVAETVAVGPGVRTVPVNLNTYMEEHAVFASRDTVMRRMPYARAVSYESR